MKLLDFLSYPDFNALRFQMGAKLIPYWKERSKLKVLDEDAIRRLGREGIDVDLDEVRVEPDYTLTYKGKRVVVYIRDVALYRERQAMPRYHVAYCRTLDQMRQANRWTRYVVATRDDGKFQVTITGTPPVSKIEELHICQNCLDLLGWDGFSYSGTTRGQRREIIDAFTLKRFFEHYPKDLLSIIPTHDADLAPLNDYTEDWGLVSEQVKKDGGYKCESCGRKLEGPDARYLHVHHRDGQKNNNARCNLVVLCLGCHAEQPMHTHMRGTAALHEFEMRFRVR